MFGLGVETRFHSADVSFDFPLSLREELFSVKQFHTQLRASPSKPFADVDRTVVAVNCMGLAPGEESFAKTVDQARQLFIKVKLRVQHNSCGVVDETDELGLFGPGSVKRVWQPNPTA